MGIDAFAELDELDVIEPELECESDLNEEADAVLDCKADEESESIFETVASTVNVEKNVSEIDDVVVNDDSDVSLNTAEVVASVDCDTLELTVNEIRDDADT